MVSRTGRISKLTLGGRTVTLPSFYYRSMPGADDWTLYAEHRTHLTDVLLCSTAKAGGKLCLLGAGHCNDVDLERLAATFAEIHLVDIDAKALDEAKARQSPEVRSRVVTHGNVDLAGLTPKRLRKWRTRPPSSHEVEASGIATLEWILERLPRPFDVVASTCVLTQLAFMLLSTSCRRARL